MTKVLTFKVEIFGGLETKIWRKIEITDRRKYKDKFYICDYMDKSDYNEIKIIILELLNFY